MTCVVNAYATQPKLKHTGVGIAVAPVVCANAFCTTSPPIMSTIVRMPLGLDQVSRRAEATRAGSADMLCM